MGGCQVIALDTHALVWWVANPSMLSKKAKTAIHKELEGGQILVSAISAWEVSALVARRRLIFSMDPTRWFDTLAQIEAVRMVPVDVEIGIRSVELPGEFHKDPADRMIVATARKYAVPLVTKDEKIRAYPHVKTIW
jgi:PIN domain nuclease of toxin-antitoxin system